MAESDFIFILTTLSLHGITVYVQHLRFGISYQRLLPDIVYRLQHMLNAHHIMCYRKVLLHSFFCTFLISNYCSPDSQHIFQILPNDQEFWAGILASAVSVLDIEAKKADN